MTGTITILTDERDEDNFPIFKGYSFEQIKFDHAEGIATVFLKNQLSFCTPIKSINRIWVE